MIIARLRQVAQLRVQLSRQRTVLAAAAFILAALFLVAFLDVRVGLPWIARFGALLAILAAAVTIFRKSASLLAERDAARLVEEAHPELGQSVRTAAQIAPTLDPSRPPIETELVEQTGRRVTPLPLDKELAPRRQLAPFAFAVGGFALCWIFALSLSTDWRIAAARALGFPISFTGVKVSASPEQLEANEAVRIVATVSGRPTSQAVIHIRTEGEDWRELPMASVAAKQFDVMLPSVAKPFEFYVSSGDGRSTSGHIAVHIPPKLQKITARLEYPEYLGLAPVEQTGGDFEAVEGTKAQADLEFDRPVLDARVVFSDGESAPIQIAGAHGRASILLSAKERTWRVAGRDPGGVAFETPPHRLKGSVDQPPAIKLAEPRGDVEVTALQELIARVQAKDDYGLASVGVLLQIGANTETVMEKKFEARDVKQAAEMATAFLEKYPLTLNDSLLVYAYATDHKPRDGARIVSPLAAVDIREFKRLYRQAGEGNKECKCQDLVEKMITLERAIYSDTTQLKELGGNQEVPKALVLPLIPRQQAVIVIGQELQAMLDEYLDPEMREIQESGRLIFALMTKVVASLQALRLTESCTDESAALTELLKLRKQMIYKFTKKSSGARMTQSKPLHEQEQRATLTQLAEQLEAAAKEEQAVTAQAQALAPAAETPAALRRQQEAATGDVGEVLTELDTHPGATDVARERGTQAETLMNAASKALSGSRTQAAPALAQSEAALRELAAHLRLLDQPPDEKTLAKLEERAEKAAACLTGCAKCAKEGAGKSPGSGTGSKPGESGKGETPGGKEGGPHEETPAEFAAKVAALSEQARTLNDALRHWSGDGNGQQQPARAALGRLAEAQKTDQLGKELAALAESLAKTGEATKPGEGAPANGKADLAAQAAKLSEKHQEIAAALRQEREAQRQTRAQQLTELRNRLQEVAGDNFTGQPDTRGAPLEPPQPARPALARSLAGDPINRRPPRQWRSRSGAMGGSGPHQSKAAGSGLARHAAGGYAPRDDPHRFEARGPRGRPRVDRAGGIPPARGELFPRVVGRLRQRGKRAGRGEIGLGFFTCDSVHALASIDI